METSETFQFFPKIIPIQDILKKEELGRAPPRPQCHRKGPALVTGPRCLGHFLLATWGKASKASKAARARHVEAKHETPSENVSFPNGHAELRAFGPG